MSYKYRESEQRELKYSKDASAERFLDVLNEALRPLEPVRLIEPERVYPIVFVIGLHRSGTTLATQLIAHCLDMGYVNNLIARFWLAPVTGTRLSLQTLGNIRRISFTSDYGKTEDITEPHEFSYFWHHWFRMENIPPYDRADAASKIDWEGFAMTLRNMAATWQRPLMLKAPDVGYHIERIASVLPEALFVLTDRLLPDVACSIRKGRIAYYGSEDVWLGSYPDEWDTVRHLPGKEQIAWQVVSLDRMYKRGFKILPRERNLVVTLSDLCAQPQAMLDSVCERIRAMGFNTPGRLASAPVDKVRYSTSQSSAEYREFEDLITQINRQISTRD